ncbi:hypothetical protein FRY74_06300 [Vicingus serpentipes]|uniref:Uncharacterized protein n=1 Tax=Vicingus serpentipes TaxID=1926625 RepID=A0A5C6RX51_9FLAO|nr:hypothetical protein [Vicingus serpentipes]TXB66180.1 hypothetical protein FRY74_06300 [Vicingus serpentipes]
MKKLILTLSAVLFSTVTFSQTFKTESLMIKEAGSSYMLEILEADDIIFKNIDVDVKKKVVSLEFKGVDGKTLSEDLITIEQELIDEDSNKVIRGINTDKRHTVLTFTKNGHLMIEYGTSYEILDSEECMFFLGMIH